MTQWDVLLENLEKNKIVSYKSDTIPSIYARLNSNEDLREVKRREEDKPFILLVSSINMLLTFISEDYSKEEVNDIVTKHEGETIVFQASKTIDKKLKVNESIAIRIPNLKELRNIINKLGEPIFSTSANSQHNQIKKDKVLFLDGWDIDKDKKASRIFSHIENKYIR